MLAKGTAHWVIVPFIFGLTFLIFLVFKFLVIFLLSMATFFLLSFGFLIFFRDPERPLGRGIVAPADGRIINIKIDNDDLVISTFMNLHNVHVNRAPIDGRVIKIERLRGKHLPAFREKANYNEQQITILNTKIGEVKIIQIAGVLARRIVSYIKEEETLIKGQRIGIIKFGSRVDLYLPKKNVKLSISPGEKVIANLTTIAEGIGYDEMD